MNYLRTKRLAKLFQLAALAVLLSLGQFAQAQDPAAADTGESALYRGEQLYQSGSFVAAIDVFKTADGLDRNEGVVGASRSYAMLGRYDDAIDICEELIDGGDYADFPLVSTQLAEMLRGLFSWGEHAAASIRRQLSEYILEEGRLSPPALELEDFYQQVHSLSLRVDRLESRARRVAARIDQLNH